MTGLRSVVFVAAVGAVLAAQTLVVAQMPGTSRHVRIAPIEVGRRVLGTPIINEPGSFSAMPASRGANIFGIVQSHVGTLVPFAGVVLVRDLYGGAVVARSAVNGAAQFSARGLPAGVYTAELIGEGGNVIAGTPAFTALMGQQIQLAQTIPANVVPGLGRAVSSATTAALSSAAGSGVMALAPGAPVSPES